MINKLGESSPQVWTYICVFSTPQKQMGTRELRWSFRGESTEAQVETKVRSPTNIAMPTPTWHQFNDKGHKQVCFGIWSFFWCELWPSMFRTIFASIAMWIYEITGLFWVFPEALVALILLETGKLPRCFVVDSTFGQTITPILDPNTLYNNYAELSNPSHVNW